MVGDCIKIFVVSYCLCCVIETIPPLELAPVANIQETVRRSVTVQTLKIRLTIHEWNDDVRLEQIGGSIIQNKELTVLLG